MAQGKFSKPRTNKHTDAEITVARVTRKKVAADPIEKAEADIAKFMDSASETPVTPISPTDETQILTDVDLLRFSQVPDQEAMLEVTQLIPDTAESQLASVPGSHSRKVSQVEPEPEEEEYEEEPTFFERNRKPVLIGGISAILVLLIAIIGMVVALNNRNTDDGRILNNVIAAGVNIGGMTPDEAKIAIYNATAETYDVQDMVVTLPDTMIAFSPADTGVSLNVDALVEAAYNYGRVGTEAEVEKAKAQVLVGQYVMDILPYLQLDAQYIHETLQKYGESFNSSYLSSSYVFEGTKPGLTAETFDETVPCQILLLKIGTPGRNLDIESVYTQVLEAYSSNIFSVDASEAPEEMPELPDLDAIFAEYCSTPVDAYMDMQSFEVTGEIYGYTFDLEAARGLLADAEFGTTIQIPMTYLLPQVTTADLIASMYADTLGSCQTPHTGDANRNTNLRLACQAIHGLVLQPGEEFSFNRVVGERTSERGYRSAPAYADGETVSELGGGVCQVSSTLYYCVLLADLEVLERQNHSYISSYIEKGMDATVSWDGPDFRFRNSTSYPIRIEAEVFGGNVSVRLIGKDEKDYYIKMVYDVAGYLKEETEYKEFPHDNEEGYTDGDVIRKGENGQVVDTYKAKYSKSTDELITEEYVTRSSYRPRNQVIAKVAQPTTAPTEAPTVAPTEVPTEAPTQAPTEAATETPTQAPTEAATEAPTQAPTEAAEETESPDVPDLEDPEP